MQSPTRRWFPSAIGVGIAIAVVIDATIIRLLLVPSLMKLFGDWNWWLPFRKKNS